MENKGSCYLLHFDKKLSHSQHYLGWTKFEDVAIRVNSHRAGRGAIILKAACKAGIKFDVVKTWADVDRNFERKLKRSNNLKRFCPVCKALAEAEATNV